MFFQKLCVGSSFVGKRLDFVLQELLPAFSLRARRRLCESGQVLLEGKIAKPGAKLKLNQNIELNLLDSSEQFFDESFLAGRPKIIAMSDDFIAIFKPRKWHSVRLKGGASSSIEDILPLLFKDYLKVPKLLNRLDYYTSGILLASFNAQPEVLKKAGAKLCKLYIAVVAGELCGIDELNSKLFKADILRQTKIVSAFTFSYAQAKNLLELISADYTGQVSLLVCQIYQGARHQIRKDLASLGYPLLGDVKYNGLEAQGFLLHHFYFKYSDFSVFDLPIWLKLLPNGIENNLQGVSDDYNA